MVHLQSIYEGQLCHNDGESLEVHSLPAIVLQVVHTKHGRVGQVGDLGHDPFEICEERGVVEGPFRRLLVVPFPQRQAVGDCQPVPVHFKIGRFAVAKGVVGSAMSLLDISKLSSLQGERGGEGAWLQRQWSQHSLCREEKNLEGGGDYRALREGRVDFSHKDASMLP